MKLHGRITVFGEYLLREKLSYCYSIKSKLFLSNSVADSYNIHSTYEQEKDATIPLLKLAGELKFVAIYGNLPFGFGLSSSTILSLLHLNSEQRRELVVNIDREMCGFTPSELDYTTITKQENGIFGFGKWHKTTGLHPIYSLIIIPKERKLTLPKVIQKLSTTFEKQILITKKLYSELSTENVLNYDLLLEYSKHLLSCDVYSDSAKEIVSTLLKKDMVAKCIGGLYDKAILVVHKSEDDKIACDNYIQKTYSFAKLFE